MGVFKGFLSRAYKICTEKYFQGEIDFLIGIFTKNGHKIADIDATNVYR